MTEESLLAISASIGEILRYAQNDRVVFWFCFYVLVILESVSDRRISTYGYCHYGRDSSLRSE